MSLIIAAAVFAMVSSSSEAPVTAPETASSPTATASQATASQASTSQATASEASTSKSTDPSDAKSYAKAQSFLAEVDAGDWSGSWEVAGDFIQKQVPAATWEATVKPVREPLGKVTSRSLKSIDKTKELPGAPAGDYEVLQFTTTFADHDAVLTETVIMIKTEDGFDLAGFFIR